MIEAIPTEYKNIKFRSKLEVKWAVFFDECGIEYVYEHDGYRFQKPEDADPTNYIPDFILKNVGGSINGNLYVEVKGVMDIVDAKKIKGFVREGRDSKTRPTDTPVLVLGDIPDGFDIYGMLQYMKEHSEKKENGFPPPFNFWTINGENTTAYPGINRNGHFEIFSDDFISLNRMNRYATERAFRSAYNSCREWWKKPEIQHCYRYADKYAKR